MKSTLNGVVLLLLILSSGCQSPVGEAINAATEKIIDEEQKQKAAQKKENIKKRSNGTFTNTNSNGTGSTFTLVNGIKQGAATQNFANGKVWKEVNYKDDKLDGLTKVYHRKGYVDRTVEYKNGKKHGWYKKLFKSGKEKIAIEYQNGRPLPGLKRVDYRGNTLPEPTVIREMVKNVAVGKAIYNISYALSEKFKDITFYALPDDKKWEDLKGSEFAKYQLYTKAGEAVFSVPVEEGYFIKMEQNLIVTFTLPKGQKAAIAQKMDFILQN